jgi:hypothetical protein
VRGHRDEVERSTDDVVESLAATLANAGWARRDLGNHVLATFTRDLPGGVLLGAEVDRTSFRWPQGWPVDLGVRMGVGSEAALDLMPLLTLRPSPWVLAAQSLDEPPFTVSWDDERGGSNAARQLVRHIEVASESLAERYGNLDAVIAAVKERRQSRVRSAAGLRHDLALELTLLTAEGHRDEVNALLGTYADAAGGDQNQSARRFLRQLTRWLDAGKSSVPPIAETLAVLPPERPLPRVSLSDTRAKSKTRREALDATRAHARGKTQAELVELLTTEYGRRGLQVSPTAVAMLASILQAEQRPFGRAFSALAAVKALKAFGTDSVRLVKTAGESTTPDWLQPPQRASYVLRAPSRAGFVSVIVDADADAWLTRVSEVARALGQLFLVNVWLTLETAPETQDQLVAHVGQRRVGIVSAADAGLFDVVLRSAALFDEDPLLRGHLSRPPGQPTWLLEVPKP